MTVLKELIQLNEANVKRVKLSDRKFKVTKKGNNGGDVGNIIDMEWFTNTYSAPYYLPGGDSDRKSIKALEVGEEMTVQADSGSIRIKRTV